MKGRLKAILLKVGLRYLELRHWKYSIKNQLAYYAEEDYYEITGI